MAKWGFASAMLFLFFSCGTTAHVDRLASVSAGGEPAAIATPQQVRILGATPEMFVLKVPEQSVVSTPPAALLERFPTLLVQPKPDTEFFIVKVVPDPNIEYRMPVIGQDDDEAWGEVAPQMPRPRGESIPGK